jgi:LysR family hydrogen peroxide-inducible transcriptional activator
MTELKLKDLRYLVAVADTGHFGKAAARCFVSQPTLSAQLKKLEDYLGVPLLERQARRTLLTPAGEQIVARARRIIDSSEEVVEIAKAHRDPLAGKLRVAFLPTIGPYLLPLVAPKLRKALPRLELLLYEYQTVPMLEKLRAGELDMGVLALPIDDDWLLSQALYDEAFVLAAPAEHPLTRKKQIKPEDLREATLLLLEDGHCLRDQALEVCSHLPVREKQDFRATSIETLRQMVAAGAGVTLLPELATRGGYAALKGLALRPFAKPAPTRQIGAVWRKSSPRHEAIHAVIECIAEHAP